MTGGSRLIMVLVLLPGSEVQSRPLDRMPYCQALLWLLLPDQQAHQTTAIAAARTQMRLRRETAAQQPQHITSHSHRHLNRRLQPCRLMLPLALDSA